MTKRTEIEPFNIISRAVGHPGNPSSMCNGATVRTVAGALRECDQDGVVMFALLIPDGTTIFAGVSGVIRNYDGSGSCAVLVDSNVMAAMMAAKR